MQRSAKTRSVPVQTPPKQWKLAVVSKNNNPSTNPREATNWQMPVQFVVQSAQLGQRVDAFLAERLSGISRAKLRKLIDAGHVQIDGKPVKSSARLKPGDRVVADIVEPPTDMPRGEDIPLNILYEDDDLVAIDKPAAMVVHPAKGHWRGTLTSGLIFHFQKLSGVGGPQRPGIVHRLDRDTTGVIIVAKNDEIHMKLTEQFERRLVEKKYIAVVSPPPEADQDVVNQPIGVHPYQREKMAIRSGHPSSRPAETFFRVRFRAGRYAVLEVFPRTGRTHQIRVHLAHQGSPIVCDRLYSGRAEISEQMVCPHWPSDDIVMTRQALHAASIRFQHPRAGQSMAIEAPLPQDMHHLVELLQQY